MLKNERTNIELISPRKRDNEGKKQAVFLEDAIKDKEKNKTRGREVHRSN